METYTNDNILNDSLLNIRMKMNISEDEVKKEAEKIYNKIKNHNHVDNWYAAEIKLIENKTILLNFIKENITTCISLSKIYRNDKTDFIIKLESFSVYNTYSYTKYITTLHNSFVIIRTKYDITGDFDEYYQPNQLTYEELPIKILEKIVYLIIKKNLIIDK
jgi:hypothetical protein